MAWEVVKAFIAADARMPKEVALPRPAAREVARYLVDRHQFPVLEVVDALSVLAQPELLRSESTEAGIIPTGVTRTDPTVNSVLAPHPLGLTTA